MSLDRPARKATATSAPSREELVRRARLLAGSGRRRLLGIAGPPGAGKSSLAEALVAAVGSDAALVGMDGFHLAGGELTRLGRAGRKGAPDTFDAEGYVALLQRLRDHAGRTVYAPRFDRRLEEPIAGAVPVGPEVALVVTEGNYLLLSDEPWCRARTLLDEVWYVELDDGVRLRRLIERHQAYGRTAEQAADWARTVDQPNAELVATTRERADLIVRLASRHDDPVPGPVHRRR